MPTGIIKAENAFNPEVWADLALGEFKGKTRILEHATSSDTLAGQPGDTLKFPKWTTLGEMDELTEGVAMTTETLDQTVGTATIKEVGKAIEFTDTRALVGMGDVQTEAVRQFGILAARKLDTDLIAAAEAETKADAAAKVREQKPYKITGAALNWPTIVDALSLFGDDWEPSTFAGLFVRSDQAAALMKDDQFINVSKIGGTSPVASGQLGTIAGLRVIVTDRLPKGKFMLLKPGALGVIYKRRPLVETDRDILKRTRVVTTTMHYAVKRLNDKGVLVGTLGA